MSDALEREQARLQRHTAPRTGSSSSSSSNSGTGVPRPGRTLCCACGRPAYALESVETEVGLYHSACLRCAQCGLTLAPGTFRCAAGRVYCRQHAPQAASAAAAAATAQRPRPLPTAPPQRTTTAETPTTTPATQPVCMCAGCGAPVRAGDAWATACGGRTWHARCLRCAQCGRVLGAGAAHYEAAGRPFCSAACAAAAAGCVCVRCGAPVADGECVLLGGAAARPCHARCYTCAACGASLLDADCYDIGGRELCRACALAATGASSS